MLCVSIEHIGMEKLEKNKKGNSSKILEPPTPNLLKISKKSILIIRAKKNLIPLVRSYKLLLPENSELVMKRRKLKEYFNNWK